MIDFGTIALSPQAERLPYSSAKLIGVYSPGTYRARGFASLPDGREIEIRNVIPPLELGNRVKDGELWLERGEETIRAFVVPPGTLASLQAADEARAASKVAARRRLSTVHRFDAAEFLPALDRREEKRTVQESVIATGDDAVAARFVAEYSKHKPRLLTTPGRGPVRGVVAILECLRAEGIELEAVGDFLDARGRRLDPGLRDVIVTFERLLVGLLVTEPIPCALAHPDQREAPDAWTVTVSGLPVCEAHLDEGTE